MSYNTEIKYTNAYIRFRLPRDVYLDTFIGLKEDDDDNNGNENDLVNEVLENDDMTLIVEDYEKIKARNIIINNPENNVNNAEMNAGGNNNGIIGIEELNQCLQNMELNGDEKLGGDKDVNMTDILYDITSPGHTQLTSASIIDSTDHLMRNKNTNDIKKEKESNIINEYNNIIYNEEKNDYNIHIKDNDAELEVKYVPPANNNYELEANDTDENQKLVKKVQNESLKEKRSDYIKNIKLRKWKWIDDNYYNKWKEDIDEKMNRLDYKHGILNRNNNNINKITSLHLSHQNYKHSMSMNTLLYDKSVIEKSSKTSQAVENISVMNTVTVLYIIAAVVLFVTIVANFIVEFYGEFNELQQYIDATWSFILPVLHMFILEDNNKNVNSIVELQITSIGTCAQTITDNQTVSNNMQIEI